MNLRRVPARHGVRGDVAGHHAVGRHDGPVADFDAGHDHALAAQPDVVADARCRPCAAAGTCGQGVASRPGAAEDVEGVGRPRCRSGGWPGPMMKVVPWAMRAELADNEPVAELRVVEEHVVALEARGVGVVVVICVVAYLYVRGAVTTFFTKHEVPNSFGNTTFGIRVCSALVTYLRSRILSHHLSTEKTTATERVLRMASISTPQYTLASTYSTRSLGLRIICSPRIPAETAISSKSIYVSSI